VIIPGMHVFTFCETIGPFMCEMDECNKPAWSAVLTDQEHSTLPEGVGGEDLAHHIIFHHVGKRACKSCIKKLSTG